MSADLIDTTEMYLKTVFELEEDGIVPLRARIVERLGHSGPTVSQTVARMERDGLLTLREDRRLDLTTQGRALARDVMRKHRLAERLLVDVIGMDWAEAHEEACRWEHVMSAKVEEYLPALLGDPETDPYGNPVPGLGEQILPEFSIEVLLDNASRQGVPLPLEATVTRIGEPVQAEEGLLALLQGLGVLPGARIEVTTESGVVRITPLVSLPEERKTPDDRRLMLEKPLTQHLFVTVDENLV